LAQVEEEIQMAQSPQPEDAPAATDTAAVTTQRVQLGMRLQPMNNSDQPIFSNFTMVQGAPGTVFVDFGFLEPSVMPALARQVRSGGKVPEAIDGRLACRVALGLDAAAQLAQQLNQHLRSVQAQVQQAAKARETGKK